MSRSHPSQLPSGNELVEIIKTEANRSLAAGKEDLHFVDFSTILELLEHYQLPTELFTAKLTTSDVIKPGYMQAGDEAIKSLLEKILADSNKPTGLLNQYYDYLAEEDPLENGDLIFVFGSKTFFRVEKAAELFIANRAPKILISGGHPIYDKDSSFSEAEVLAEHAVKMGIPKESIILERLSITVADNVKRSLNILDELHIPYQTIILINSPYVQRRGWAFLQKYVPENVKLVRINSLTKPEYSRELWHTDPTGAKIVLNEVFKLKVAEALNTA